MESGNQLSDDTGKSKQKGQHTHTNTHHMTPAHTQRQRARENQPGCTIFPSHILTGIASLFVYVLVFLVFPC